MQLCKTYTLLLIRLKGLLIFILDELIHEYTDVICFVTAVSSACHFTTKRLYCRCFPVNSYSFILVSTKFFLKVKFSVIVLAVLFDILKTSLNHFSTLLRQDTGSWGLFNTRNWTMNSELAKNMFLVKRSWNMTINRRQMHSETKKKFRYNGGLWNM